jgi:hypothetical protein
METTNVGSRDMRENDGSRSPTTLLSPEAVDEGEERVDVPLLRRVLDGPGGAAREEEHSGEAAQLQLRLCERLLLAVGAELGHLHAGTRKLLGQLEVGGLHRLAEWAPRRVEDHKPRLRAAVQPEEVLDPGAGEGDDGLALEDVRGAGAVAIGTLGSGLALLDVSLVEAALLCLGVLPPPPAFPLVLPRKDRPGARLATDGHVTLSSMNKCQVHVHSKASWNLGCKIDYYLSMQGVHWDVHGPQEGPDVVAVDIGHGVPLDQATSSTIQPFERRINLHISTR